MAEPPPVPLGSPVVERGVLHREMVRFFESLRTMISRTVQLLGSVSLTAQGATISTTPVPTGPLPVGRYRVSYTLQITRAATTSSSAQMALSWTFNSIASLQAFPAVTGNTLTSYSTDSIVVNVDQGTTISYQVTYASVGATSMQYAVAVWVEQLP